VASATEPGWVLV
jgi:hypothetical protein